MKGSMGGYLTGLLLVLGAAVVVAGCGAAPPGRAAGPPRADAVDLAAVHDPESGRFQADCLACHADIMKRTTLKSGIKEAHAAMIPFVPGYDAATGVTNDTCAACHGKVDLLQHSGMQLRRNADIASCQACHGKDGAATKKFYAN